MPCALVRAAALGYVSPLSVETPWFTGNNQGSKNQEFKSVFRLVRANSKSLVPSSNMMDGNTGSYAVETCGGTNLSVSLSRCQLFEAGFHAEFLHLNDPSCTGQIQDDRVVFSFNNNECGTILKTNSSHFIYENTVQVFYGQGPQSVINRDNRLNVNLSCVYPFIQTVDVSRVFKAERKFVNVFVHSVVSKNLPGTQGTYHISLVPYTDATYTIPLAGNSTLDVNQQIYLSVDVTGVDSQQFVAVLDSCWATPYNIQSYPVRWDLVTNECPNPLDGTVQVLQNGISLSDCFSFRMFTFTRISSSFYLHCEVHLCLRNGGQCALSCSDNDGDEDDQSSERRQRRHRSLDFHDTTAISMSF
ncbi:pancreatic secretory granule membrane major glycoprotein GP2-like [Hoplias malabaricus]|uniref:pancreatic secretory granule membrane major glycoprotein GP2-like n=1 Tax=Hoplias malabaricus TaxID=27720 RepID=UPI0034635819